MIVTLAELHELHRQAQAEGKTLSHYLRGRLGLPELKWGVGRPRKPEGEKAPRRRRGAKPDMVIVNDIQHVPELSYEPAEE